MNNFFLNLDFSEISFQENIPFQELIEAINTWTPECQANIIKIQKKQTDNKLIEDLEYLFFKIEQSIQMVSSYYNYNQTEDVGLVLEEANSLLMELMTELTSNEVIYEKLLTLEKETDNEEIRMLAKDWSFAFRLAGCGLELEKQKELLELDKK